MTYQPNSSSKGLICRNCGHQNLSNAKICLFCDAPLGKTSRFRKEQSSPGGLLPPNEEEQLQTQLFGNEHDKQVEQPDPPSAVRKTGIKCHDCGFLNRVGDLFCVECGANISTGSLVDLPADRTQKMKILNTSDIQAAIDRQQTPDDIVIPNREMKRQRLVKPELQSLEADEIPIGCFQFTDEMILRFTDVDSGRYTEIMPDHEKPMLIGRSHESLPVQPDIDLTPFLTEQHGVSRRHALLRLRDLRLEIQDLNSTNGTGINGFRFRAKEVHQLRNGDVITLGQVSMKLLFLRKDSQRGGHITDILSS